MLLELLQLVDIILFGKLHALILFFFSFILIPTVVKRIAIRGYSFYYGWTNAGKFSTVLSKQKFQKISVIVPVYDEDPDRFDACLNSITMQTIDELIVVHDKMNDKIKEIALKYNSNYYNFNKRLGKRNALALGIKASKNDLLLFVDSDTVLENNALEEMLKPLMHEDIGAVTCVHNVARIGNSFGSYLSWKLSFLIESTGDK